MIILTIPEGHESTIFDAEELSRRGVTGWTPAAMFEEERIQKGGQEYRDGRYVDEPSIKYKVVRVIAHRGAEEALAAAANRASYAERRAQDAESKVLDVTREKEKCAAELKETTSRLISTESRWQNESRRVTEFAERARKMEVDLGKIRQALGDLRMKEILEGSGK